MTKSEFKRGYSEYRAKVRKAMGRLDVNHFINAVNDGSVFRKCFINDQLPVGIRSHCHIRGI